MSCGSHFAKKGSRISSEVDRPDCSLVKDWQMRRFHDEMQSKFLVLFPGGKGGCLAILFLPDTFFFTLFFNLPFGS